jgi:drug/metabolite transporter (DMT)-like permease
MELKQKLISDENHMENIVQEEAKAQETDKQRSTNPGSKRDSTFVKPTSNRYLIFACIAALCFAVSAIIRGLKSEHVFSSKFVLSLAFLISSVIFISVKKFQARVKGQTFVMPWYINEVEEERGKSIGKMDKVQFNGKVLMCLICGGVFEFCGSVMVLLSFSYATEAQMNQGVCNSLITVSGVIIVVMSYILYKEFINVPQGVGILFILVSVVLISLTKVEAEPAEIIVVIPIAPSNSTVPIVPGATPAQVDKMIVVEDHSGAQALAVITALVASCCFAGESLLIRYLSSWGLTGEVAGFFYLFFEGLIGTVCLIIYTATGHGFMDYDTGSILLLLVAGFAITGGVVLVNYSISIGVAGVCFSISNSNAALQALFTYLLFGQDLSLGQVFGIVVSLVGACILALNEQLDCCTKVYRKTEKVEEKETGDEKTTRQL